MEQAAKLEAQDRAHATRGASTNFLTLLGQTGLFAFGVLGARLFGPAAWGAYTTATAWIDVLTRASLAGGDKTVLVFVAARRAERDEAGVYHVLANVLRVTLAVAAIAAAAMFLVSWPVAKLSGDALDGRAMRLLAPVVVTSSLSALLLAATMATKTLRFNFVAKGAVEPLLSVCLVLALGLVAPTLPALAAVPLLAGAATLGVSAWALGRCFELGKVVRNLRAAPIERPIVRFGFPLAAAELVNVLMYRLATFVLVAFTPVAERGVFNTCFLLATTVSYLRGLFDTVLAPVAAEAFAQKDFPRLGRNLARASRLVLLAAIPLGSLYMIGGPTVLALFGPDFVAGHRTLGWLALGHIINASFGLTGWVLMAAGRTRTILTNNLMMLALNTALCLWLIPRLGIEGAAMATTLSIAALQALQGVQAWRVARVSPLSKDFVRLAAIGVLVIAAELTALRLLASASAAAPLVVALLGMPVYAGLAWLVRALPSRGTARIDS